MTLLEAFFRISKEHHELNLRLVGHGELFEQCKDFIKTHKLENRIILTGHIPHSKMDDIYNDSFVIIIPSIGFENCSMVILESMARGIPVIASDSGGNPELIENGKTGLIFQRGNIESLLDALVKISLKNLDLPSYSINARKHQQQYFQLARTVERYLEILSNG